MPTAQASQAAPPVPQIALVVPGWQTPFASQQPAGQLFASHKQLPPPGPATHSCPAGQALQAAPSAPHSVFEVPARQLTPLQQPVAHSAGLQKATHCWPLHSLPPVQATQRLPPLPHAPVAVPGWQLPLPSQQPAAQLVASHVHTPLTQSCPEAHVTQAPPPVPQSASVPPG